MSNLENFNNIYANLSESSYNNRPVNFPIEQLSSDKKERLKSGQSLKFNFSKDAKNKNGKTIINRWEKSSK